MGTDAQGLVRYDFISDPTTLQDIVSDAIDQNRRCIEARQIEFDLDLEQGLVPAVATIDLKRAILKALQIAITSSPVGGTVCVTGFGMRERIILEIADDGPGFNQNALETLSGRSVNAAPQISAEGIRLLELTETVRRWGGKLSVKNCPEGGGALTFLLLKPRPQVLHRAAA